MRAARLALGAFVVLVVWVGVGVVCLLLGARSAGSASDRLDELRANVSPESLFDGSVDADLREVRNDLARAETLVSSPATWLLRPLPGVGRQVSSAQSLTSAGVDAIDIGIDALARVDAILDGPMPSGGARLDLLDEVVTVVRDGQAAIAEVDLGPDHRLLSRLADARDAAEVGIADIGGLLDDAEVAALAVRSLLDDSRTLLVAANNAEMRSGSGMFLQVGMLEGVDGRLEVDGLEQSGDLFLDEGIPADSVTYDDRWGWLEPTREWRNLALSPRFDVTAPLAARMWVASGRPEVDGVVAVDPFALRAVLRATGPVTVNGIEVSADNVLQLIFHDQYENLANRSQAARRETLGEIAAAVLDELSTGTVDPVVLLTELREAAAGRHVLAWSPDPEVQAGWEAVGIDGAMGERSVMVSLMNRGANKLDPYIEMDARLGFERNDDGVVVGTLAVNIRNQVPDGEDPYIAGPVPEVEQTTAYGDYFGLLSITLPGTARNAVIEGRDELQVAGPDGPTLTVAGTVLVAQGERKFYKIVFEVPDDLDSIRLEASGRPIPIDWTLAGTTVTDAVSATIPLSLPKG